MAKALGVSRILIAIEKNKPAAIAAFEGTEFDVVPLKKQYPMGAEKQLIYCCTGRKVPLGKLPACRTSPPRLPSAKPWNAANR